MCVIFSPKGWRPVHPAASIASRSAVEVWLIALDQTRADGALLWRLLGDDDRARIATLRDGGLRLRATIAWGTLRWILGRALAVDPRTLTIYRASSGKPRLLGGKGLAFSLSHSGSLAAVAVTREGEVGVDLERLRKDWPGLQVIERLATRRECRLFAGLSAAAQRAAFFRLWVRREALLKAAGVGFAEGERPGCLGLSDGNWVVHDLAVWPGYVGALATSVGGAPFTLHTAPPGRLLELGYGRPLRMARALA
jgi:4'-phosphopantetheinyl transferase